MPEFRDVEHWLNSKVKPEIDRQARGLKMELFSHVVMNTRVDTGLLRGNWQASEGSPVDFSIDRKDISGAEVLAEINSTIQADSVSYLSNNLVYAPVWNEVDGYVDGAIALFGQLSKTITIR